MDELVITLFTIPGLLKRRKWTQGRGTLGSRFWRRKNPTKSSRAQPPVTSGFSDREYTKPLSFARPPPGTDGPPPLCLWEHSSRGHSAYHGTLVLAPPQNHLAFPHCSGATLGPNTSPLLSPLSAHNLRYGLAIYSLFKMLLCFLPVSQTCLSFLRATPCAVMFSSLKSLAQDLFLRKCYGRRVLVAVPIFLPQPTISKPYNKYFSELSERKMMEVTQYLKKNYIRPYIP